MERKVVITGLGLISPLGSDLKLFWERISSGKSGIRTIQGFDSSALDSHIAGEVIEFNADDYVSKKEQRRMDLFCQYAIAASQLAVRDAGLSARVMVGGAPVTADWVRAIGADGWADNAVAAAEVARRLVGSRAT